MGFLPWFIGLGIACPALSPAQIPAELVATASGTGRTTGHIADLVLYNPGNIVQALPGGAFYIPSSGMRQPYLVPDLPPVNISPRDSLRMLVEGYCTDIYRPPAPMGESMPRFDTWVRIGPLAATWAPDPARGWVPADMSLEGLTRSSILPLRPGTEILLGHTIAGDQFPDEAAPVLLDALTRIRTTVDSLRRAGLISTPYSKDSVREKEMLVQQSFWIFSAGLSGQPYTEDDLRARIHAQYEQNSGISIAGAPPAVRDNIEQGVTELWDAFELVGTGAKVLKVADNMPRRQQHPSDGATPSTSVPAAGPCACAEAQIRRGLRVEKLDGTPVTSDSIGWHVARLRFFPPRINCPCPDNCPSECRALAGFTPYYQWPNKYGHGNHSGYSPEYRTMEFINGKGYVDIDASITNRCGTAECPQTLRTRLYLIESNSCCDEIRARSGTGALRFPLGNNGYVEIDGRQIILNLNDPDIIETYRADFNIEAIFCNLSENAVYAQLLSEATPSGGAAGGRENSLSRDVSMNHHGGGQGERPYYLLSFMQSQNGREFSFVVAIDRETCNFDIFIQRGDQHIEVACQPDVSLPALLAQVQQNSHLQDPYFWNRALQHLFQLLKHEHFQSAAEGGVSRASIRALLIARLRLAATQALLANPVPNARAALQALLAALNSGDLHQISIALVPLSGTQAFRN